MANASILKIGQEDYEYLQSLCRCRTLQAQVVDRAKILLYKAQGETNASIAQRIDVNVNTVKLCLKKFKAGGIRLALYDKPRSGHPVEITDDAKAWIANAACRRPADLGYAQELWTLKSLHQYIQGYAAQAGFPRLETVTKARVGQILKASEIKPFKARYYCEKRDRCLNRKCGTSCLFTSRWSCSLMKMAKSLCQMTISSQSLSPMMKSQAYRLLQTLRMTCAPKRQRRGLYHDYEYKRLGTVSLLAGIDLLTGEAIPLVSNTHKSSDFIEFLKILDKKSPAQDTIRVILDNHSAHKSKETRRFLHAMPDGRFEFVFTPKHGSWLNMIESFFSKMTKQMLKGIRVKSKEELIERIYKYFDEINTEPVVYHCGLSTLF